MKKYLCVLALATLVSFGLAAADLSVDAKFDLSGKDPAGSFLSFKGVIATVEKDQVDVATSASKLNGTELWNAYRADIKGLTTLPAGVQSLVKYGVSPATQYASDGPVAKKAADGTITIQYLHRGTAYKIVTDKNGMLKFPSATAYTKRVIAVLDTNGNNIISTDFSPTGKIADINWAKVWDTSIPDGKQIVAAAKAVTGKVLADTTTSTMYYFEGSLQVTLVGTTVTVKGDLNAKLLK